MTLDPPPDALTKFRNKEFSFSILVLLNSTEQYVGFAAMVHVADRVMNQEAMVTAFLAETSLAYSMAEPIIDMARKLSKDPQALAKLHLFRTTASYKMVYGTSKTVNNNLVKTLQTTPFALNMDEATASNNSRVCAVLVTYSKGNKIVTEHLNSFTIYVVSIEILFQGMKSLFERLKLPWTNL